MKKLVIVILFLVITIVSSTPIQKDDDYYEDASDEIILGSIVSNEKSNVKRDAPQHFEEYRPRRQQQSGRQQFYNLLIDILATMQSSTKNDIRRAKKRELEKGSMHTS